MRRKRIISFVLLIAMFNVIGSAKLEEDTNVAEAFLGKTLQQTGFSIVEMGNDNSASVAIRGGEYCWLMDKSQGDNKSFINFTFSNAFKPSAFDGTEYEFEIDYFDSGNGYFQMYFETINNYSTDEFRVYTKNTRVWKTARFTVKNAVFSSNYKGKYDFALSINAVSLLTSKSPESIAIKRVKVTKKPKENAIFAFPTIDEIGNTFKWYEKEKIIHNKFINYLDRDITAKITFKLVSEDNIVPFSKTETYTFKANEIKEFDLDIGQVERCDVYWYDITIESEDGAVHSNQRPFELVILKTDPNGILNKDVLFATHFDRYSLESVKEGVEMLKMSNSYGTRANFSWYQLVNSSGALDYNVHPMKPAIEELKAKGLYYIPVLAGTPSFIGKGHSDMPRTEAQLQAWREYVRYAANILKDVVECYEIWNEPNHQSFNMFLEECGGDVYTELVKIAAEEIKKVDPDAKIGAPSVTGIGSTSSETGKAYFDEAMKAGMWKYADAIAIHPYTRQPVEKTERLKDIQYFKDEYAKVGKSDPDVWNTETGYTLSDSTVGTEKMKGALNCRAAILYKSYDLSEKTVFYNLEKKGTVYISREDQFGHVSGGKEEHKKYGKNYVPTISYVMVTGMNYVMAESEAAGIFDSEDKTLRISKFWSNKFNTNILTLYSTTGKQLVTLDLGATKLECYDSNGNSQEIYGNNGLFTFIADEYPQYLVGDISKVKILSNNQFIAYDKLEYSVSEGDIINIPVRKFVSEDLTVDVKLPACAELLNESDLKFIEGNAILKIKNNAPIGEKYMITINVLKDGKLVHCADLTMVSDISILSNMKVTMRNSKDVNSWDATITIQNLSSVSALKGHIEFKTPEFMRNFENVDFGVIPREKTAEVKFSLPKIVRKGEYSFEYDLVTESGKRYPFLQKLDFTLATYAETKPKIDGILEKNEWNMNVCMYADSADQIKRMDDWGGPSDISGRSAVMWDEEYFYMFAEVTDDIHNNIQGASRNWDGDSMQFGIFYGSEDFVAIGQASTTYTEIGLALSSITNKATAYRYMSHNNYYPPSEITSEDAEFAITRTGNKTCYEFKMRWDKLLTPNDKPKEGDVLGYSFLFNESDEGVRSGWIEYASGIGEMKDTTLFTYLKLIK